MVAQRSWSRCVAVVHLVMSETQRIILWTSYGGSDNNCECDGALHSLYHERCCDFVLFWWRISILRRRTDGSRHDLTQPLRLLGGDRSGRLHRADSIAVHL